MFSGVLGFYNSSYNINAMSKPDHFSIMYV